MSLYFLLGTLTYSGQTMVHRDPDLVVNTTREINVEGAMILGQYAVLGRYDFVMMADAEDNDAVARLSVEIGVRTGLHIETLPAIPMGFMADRSPEDPAGVFQSVQLSPEQSTPVE